MYIPYGVTYQFKGAIGCAAITQICAISCWYYRSSRASCAFFLNKLNYQSSPVILPVAVIVVLDVIPLPLTNPVVVVIFPLVVDIFTEDVIELPVIMPADAIVPLVVILPVDDMSHCDVHTPTPACAPTENPPLFFVNPSV